MTLLPELPLLLEAYLGQRDARLLYLGACIGLCHGGTLPAVVVKDCLMFAVSSGEQNVLLAAAVAAFFVNFFVSPFVLGQERRPQ